MSKLFRVLPAAAAVAAGAFLLSAYAADKPAADRPAGDRPAAEAGAEHAWEGRISNVDATARQLTLSDARMSPAATGTDRGAGAGADRGTGTGAAGTAPDKAAGTDRGTGTGANAGAGTSDREHAQMFLVAENAKIMIDGKAGELSELKSGMTARVYVRSAAGAGSGATPNRGTGADRATDTGAAGAGTDRGAAGAAGPGGDRGTASGTAARLTADRIEARSKGASDAGSGRDKGTESKDK